MEDLKVVFLIFSKAKLVCVETKRDEYAYSAVEKFIASQTGTTS